MDSNNQSASSSARDSSCQYKNNQNKRKLNTIKNVDCDTTTAFGKIPRKAESPKNAKASKRQCLDESLLVAAPLQDLSKGHSEKNNSFRGKGTSKVNWKEIPPQEGEPQSIKKYGSLHHWCATCNKGNGLWTTHLTKDHKVKAWKLQPPKHGERNHKVVDGEAFLWCQKCKAGSGFWGKHDTLEHRDNYRDLLQHNNNISFNNPSNTKNHHKQMIIRASNNRGLTNESSMSSAKNNLYDTKKKDKILKANNETCKDKQLLSLMCNSSESVSKQRMGRAARVLAQNKKNETNITSLRRVEPPSLDIAAAKKQSANNKEANKQKSDSELLFYKQNLASSSASSSSTKNNILETKSTKEMVSKPSFRPSLTKPANTIVTSCNPINEKHNDNKNSAETSLPSERSKNSRNEKEMSDDDSICIIDTNEHVDVDDNFFSDNICAEIKQGAVDMKKKQCLENVYHEDVSKNPDQSNFFDESMFKEVLNEVDLSNDKTQHESSDDEMEPLQSNFFDESTSKEELNEVDTINDKTQHKSSDDEINHDESGEKNVRKVTRKTAMKSCHLSHNSIKLIPAIEKQRASDRIPSENENKFSEVRKQITTSKTVSSLWVIERKLTSDESETTKSEEVLEEIDSSCDEQERDLKKRCQNDPIVSQPAINEEVVQKRTNISNATKKAVLTTTDNSENSDQLSPQSPLIVNLSSDDTNDESDSTKHTEINYALATTNEELYKRTSIGNATRRVVMNTANNENNNQLSPQSSLIINLVSEYNNDESESTKYMKMSDTLSSSKRKSRSKHNCCAHEDNSFLQRGRFRSKTDNLCDEERNWLERSFGIRVKDFLKSMDFFSAKKILSATAVHLKDLYEKWCLQNTCFNKCSIGEVARWQELARTYLNDKFYLAQYKDGGPIRIRESDDKFQIMFEVKHLSKTVNGGGGLPIRYITVMDQNDETLFDFRINIRESAIPNTGYGAFLSYLGARKLKEKAKRLSQSIMNGRHIIESSTKRPLEAIVDKMNVAVTLHGHDLHGNGNSTYFSATRLPLQANIAGQNVSVTLVPDNIHDSIQHDLRNRGEIATLHNGLGNFEMFSEEDYEPDDSIPFVSTNFAIVDLGRYGPFLKTDRKTMQEFNLKDFIFDFEPAAFNFGVSEKLRGCSQIIDVTDDTTGEPHNTAKKNIPMYINEVGHNKKLIQNVVAMEVQDRIVHYYYFQHQPLAKGQTVELLVDYGQAYEGTRRRKGYGKENVEDGLESDSHEAAKLLRDHIDRKAVNELIRSMGFAEIKTIVEIFDNRIIDPLIKITDPYLLHLLSTKTGNSGKSLFLKEVPTERQLIARFRIEWIAGLFRKRIDALNSEDMNLYKDDVRNIHAILSQRRLKTAMFTPANGDQEICALAALQWTELYAETFFQLSDGFRLFHPYDDTMWCALARTLCKNLIKDLSYLTKTRGTINQMADSIYKIASAAALSLRKLCAVVSDDSSKQGVIEAYRQIGLVQTDNKIINSHLKNLLPDQSNTDIIYLAKCGLIGDKPSDQKALYHSLDNICISLAPGSEKPQHFNPLVLRCVSTDKTASADHVKMQTCKRTNVDVEWYLLWQVMRVVHVTSLHFVQCENNCYSLEKLCDKIDVNFHSAEKVIAIKMEEPYSSMYYQYEDEFIDEDKNNDKVEALGHEAKIEGQRKDDLLIKNFKAAIPAKQPRYDGVDGTLPSGWRIEHVQRLSSNHVDRYWYTQTNKKLRSRVEVALFLDLIKKHSGDEEAAWLQFPGSRKKLAK